MAISFTQEQFEALIASMAVANQQVQQQPIVNIAPQTGSFSKCDLRFGGSRDSEIVRTFTERATIYKDVENITDIDALRGLPLLLEGSAAVWWSGVKINCATWDDAVNLLHRAFAPQRQSYKIYQDIHNNKQGVSTPIDVFLSKKRALFAELNGVQFTEGTQIDMIFGLLNVSIREKISREDITTFDDLIKKGREIEEYNRERSLIAVNHDRKTTERVKCNGCKKFGHATNECRYAKQSEDNKAPDEEKNGNTKNANSTKIHNEAAAEDVTPKFSCYGCGAPNVLRSKCENCRPKTKTGVGSLDFYAVDTQPVLPTRIRPAVTIRVAGKFGTAYIDTGAKLSVASTKLYQLLLSDGYKFTEYHANIVLADGHSNPQNVLSATVNVTLKNKIIPTTFIVLLGSNDNRTLLGVDFIEDADMLIDIPQWTFCFYDDLRVKHSFNAKEPLEHQPKSRPLSSFITFMSHNNEKQATDGNNNICDAVLGYGPPPPRVLGGKIMSGDAKLVQKTTSEKPLSSLNKSKPNSSAISETNGKSCGKENIDVDVSPVNMASPSKPIINQSDAKPELKVCISLADINIPSITKSMNMLELLSPLKCTPKRKLDSGVSHTSKAIKQRRLILERECDSGLVKPIDVPKLLSPLPNTPMRWQLHKIVTPPKNKSMARKRLAFDDGTRKHILWSEKNSNVIHIAMFGIENEVNIGNINDDQRNTLNQIIMDHGDLFAENGPATTQIMHHIDTGNHVPISCAPYRLNPKKKAELKVQIDEMLHSDIIEPSESSWAAPVVMVPKKDGGIRVCVDYRKLNAATKPDRYPLPRMDDLLHEAKSTQFMTSLDLRAGYWQVPVKIDHQEKTAFTTPFGIFQFKRLPFGLRNAPATFQRLMDRVKTGIGTNGTFLAYLDDLLILSVTFEDHMDDLKAIFGRLRHFNLRINMEKCKFCVNDIRYLGHIITANGIKTDPDKISAIQNMIYPRNIKHVQSFLQTCSWYRRFIHGFAHIAKPLTDLTKKNSIWVWESEQINAFEKLKELLTNAPILGQADETQPYTIRSDASGYAIGAVLVQGERDKEHPVEYASRLLTSAERNYCTTEREALAVIWAITKFRGYIEGADIIIETDHQALKWLMQLKSPTGRLARWALQLQPYNLEIRYITGRSNLVADSLSRPPCDEETMNICEICCTSVEWPTRDPINIRNSQVLDADLKRIIDCLEAEKPSEDVRYWTDKGYLLNSGVLYRYLPENETDEAQLVVPVNERDDILVAFHDSPMAGHPGIQRTLQKIRKGFYWQGMRTCIKKYIKGCVNCQKYKCSNQKPAGLLQTHTVNQRFEVLSIDLFGPLPKSDDEYTWILIIEDLASRWVELFPLKRATTEVCAKILIDEICLRYGTPRRVISDNGSQFVSSMMQYVCNCLSISQGLTPVYHPETNPVERKNRDLKPQLAILVANDHNTWPEKLPAIRFALNTSHCQTTGQTPSFLTFGREMRTPCDAIHDFKKVVTSDTYSSDITPYLHKLAETLLLAQEMEEIQKEKQKKYTDEHRQPSHAYQPGDLVLVNMHPISRTKDNFSAKFAPRRDGPYVILTKHGPASYSVAAQDKPDEALGKYHASALTPYNMRDSVIPQPITGIRKRGRPRKTGRHQSTNQQNSRKKLEIIQNDENDNAAQQALTDPVISPRRLRSQRGRI